MPGVGGDGAHLASLRIESHGVEVLFGHPEAVIDALAQLFGFIEHLARFVFMVQPEKQFGKLHLGHIEESLLFAGGNRRFHHGSIFIDNGIPRVLPRLIDRPLFGTGEVSVEAVSIQIIAFFPCNCLERWFDQRLYLFQIAGPMPQLRNHKWIKAGRRH